MSITRINNNIAALNANYSLERTGYRVQKSIERLSSGLRINRAGDDAAGMTIVTRIRSQVRGLDRAIMNAQDGINVINVAEGAMDEMTRRLDRIRVLAIQAANTGVNDLQARQALQDEVFQSIDEISRIADTTQFSKNRLLNGDFSVDTKIKPGQNGDANFGIRINTGPSASTLESGTHYLNIINSKKGFTHLLPGLDDNGETRTSRLGVRNASDIAVSMAFFTTGNAGFSGFGTPPTGIGGADAFTGSNIFFNGVSVQAAENTDVFTWEGVLSDGVTKFVGSVSVAVTAVTWVAAGVAGSLNSVISAINASILSAERALWGVNTNASIPANFQTVARAGTGANLGRIELFSQQEVINQSNINVKLLRDGTLATSSVGVTRSGAIGTNSFFQGQGVVGNNVTAVTGSTFVDGRFDITVDDVQGPQNRKVETNIIFRDKTGSIIGRSASLSNPTNGLMMNGTFVDGVYTGGVSISDGDTLTIRGTEADGTTFLATYTFSNDPDTDTDLNDFRFSSISGLVRELNYRTRIYSGATVADGTLTRFETGLFTLTAGGSLRLIDDLGRDDSKLNFTITFNDSPATNTPSYTINDSARLVHEGFAESATLRVNGGPPVRAKAGDVVTLYGPEATREGDVQGRVTIRLGSDLRGGIDHLDTQRSEYIGKLNGGPAVTFQNGAQKVTFIDNASFVTGVARQLTLDFDNILDITRSAEERPDPGTTLLISVVNHSMNFQIGAFAGQNFRTSIGDLRSDNLGFGRGSGRTVQDIDITTIEGANEALRIVDEALDQIRDRKSVV